MRRRETRFWGPDFTSFIGHSDVSVQAGVGGLVDLTHATRAQGGVDLVRARGWCRVEEAYGLLVSPLTLIALAFRRAGFEPAP